MNIQILQLQFIFISYKIMEYIFTSIEQRCTWGHFIGYCIFSRFSPLFCYARIYTFSSRFFTKNCVTEMNNTGYGRCSVSQIIQIRRCIFKKYKQFS